MDMQFIHGVDSLHTSRTRTSSFRTQYNSTMRSQFVNKTCDDHGKNKMQCYLSPLSTSQIYILSTQYSPKVVYKIVIRLYTHVVSHFLIFLRPHERTIHVAITMDQKLPSWLFSAVQKYRLIVVESVGWSRYWLYLATTASKSCHSNNVLSKNRITNGCVPLRRQCFKLRLTDLLRVRSANQSSWSCLVCL